MQLRRKFWLGIIFLIILSPLGLIVPKYLKAKGAFGEGKGLQIWQAPFADYELRGWKGKGLSHSSLAYIICAIAGVTAIIVTVHILSKIFIKKNEK